MRYLVVAVLLSGCWGAPVEKIEAPEMVVDTPWCITWVALAEDEEEKVPGRLCLTDKERCDYFHEGMVKMQGTLRLQAISDCVEERTLW